VDDPRALRLARQLEEAITVVQREAPLHFVVMRRSLEGLAAVVRVGDLPALRLALDEGPPWVRQRPDGQIALSLSEATLARLLCGDLTIEEGILDGSVGARGDLGHLLSWFDALASWLHGALRSPSLPNLHARFFAPVHTDADGQKGSRPC
jgi:hypothetical protein